MTTEFEVSNMWKIEYWIHKTGRRVTIGSVARVATLSITALVFLFLLVTFILAAFQDTAAMSSATRERAVVEQPSL